MLEKLNNKPDLSKYNIDTDKIDKLKTKDQVAAITDILDKFITEKEKEKKQLDKQKSELMKQLGTIRKQRAILSRKADNARTDRTNLKKSFQNRAIFIDEQEGDKN